MIDNEKTVMKVLGYYTLGLLIGTLLVFLFGGCGYRQTFRTHCHLQGQICDNLFGPNQYEIDEAQNTEIANSKKEINELSKEVESLKTVLDSTVNNVESLSLLYASNQTLLQLLQQSVANNTVNTEANTASILELSEQVQLLEERIQYQNTLIASMQISLNNLANSGDIVESYYDVCGTKPGYFNEVLLKLKSGKYIAYFESGSNRFLTVLQPGYSYRTTDGTNCYFSLNSNGAIINEHY